MTTISALLGGAVSSSRHVEHGGKRYTVRAIDQRAMAQFSERLIERVRQAAIRTYRDHPEMLAAELRKLQEDSVSGVYEFLEEFVIGSAVVVEESRDVDGITVSGWRVARRGGWIETPAGKILLISVLCDCREDEVIGLVAACGEELRHLIGATLAESLPGGAVAGRQQQDDWKPGEPPKNLRMAPAA